MSEFLPHLKHSSNSYTSESDQNRARGGRSNDQTSPLRGNDGDEDTSSKSVSDSDQTNGGRCHDTNGNRSLCERESFPLSPSALIHGDDGSTYSRDEASAPLSPSSSNEESEAFSQAEVGRNDQYETLLPSEVAEETQNRPRSDKPTTNAENLDTNTTRTVASRRPRVLSPLPGRTPSEIKNCNFGAAPKVDHDQNDAPQSFPEAAPAGCRSRDSSVNSSSDSQESLDCRHFSNNGRVSSHRKIPTFARTRSKISTCELGQLIGNDDVPPPLHVEQTIGTQRAVGESGMTERVRLHQSV